MMVPGHNLSLHICWTYHDLLEIYKLFMQIEKPGKLLFSLIHISDNNPFPSVSIDGKIHLSLRKLSTTFGLFRKIFIEWKRITTNLNRKSAWLVLVNQMYWKKRKINHQETEMSYTLLAVRDPKYWIKNKM